MTDKKEYLEVVDNIADAIVDTYFDLIYLDSDLGEKYINTTLIVDKVSSYIYEQDRTYQFNIIKLNPRYDEINQHADSVSIPKWLAEKIESSDNIEFYDIRDDLREFLVEHYDSILQDSIEDIEIKVDELAKLKFSEADDEYGYGG